MYIPTISSAWSLNTDLRVIPSGNDNKKISPKTFLIYITTKATCLHWYQPYYHTVPYQYHRNIPGKA